MSITTLTNTSGATICLNKHNNPSSIWFKLMYMNGIQNINNAPSDIFMKFFRGQFIPLKPYLWEWQVLTEVMRNSSCLDKDNTIFRKAFQLCYSIFKSILNKSLTRWTHFELFDLFIGPNLDVTRACIPISVYNYTCSSILSSTSAMQNTKATMHQIR